MYNFTFERLKCEEFREGRWALIDWFEYKKKDGGISLSDVTSIGY